MRAYQAYSKGGFSRTASTPKQAAIAFFAEWPAKRKCDIIQGDAKDGFFTVTYGRKSAGQWPSHWPDVIKKTIDTLPDTNEEEI
jgi:hypothetical protein